MLSKVDLVPRRPRAPPRLLCLYSVSTRHRVDVVRATMPIDGGARTHVHLRRLVRYDLQEVSDS